MKNIIYAILVLTFISCGKKAEVTWDTSIYSDADLTQKMMDIKKGTVVKASGFVNHKWVPKKSICITINGKEGFVSPEYVVIGQDPEKSVYKWGYNKKFEKFYNPKSKKHYKEGYEFPDLAKIPNAKIPLEDLVKDSIVE